MNKKNWNLLNTFLWELAIYSVLVVGYFLLVLHYLSGTLLQLFLKDRTAYAFVALGLIGAQGILLELFTRALFRLIRRKLEKE